MVFIGKVAPKRIMHCGANSLIIVPPYLVSENFSEKPKSWVVVG